MIGIYKITNKLNNKVYIGQSNNIERRYQEHFDDKQVTIDDYIAVLGKENFDFEVLEECTLDELSNKEQYYINLYNSKNKGYNFTKGGTNSKGEANGRAILTEKDVIFIRESYNQHKRQKEIYEYFKNKITWSQFQSVWQGRSWSHVMPEVFTEENKTWYKENNSNGENSFSAKLTNKEVINFRILYKDKTAKEIYEEYNLSDKQIKYRTFQKILFGDTYNKNIPVYKKTLNQWYLNGEPVSTISVSGE